MTKQRIFFVSRYFRQTSQASTQSNQEFNASFKQLSDTQFPNGAPRNWARQQVVAERVASMNGGQTSSYSEVREDIQDVVVERHKEKIREIVVEKHLVQSPARWAVCGIPCWCWVPLILLPLLGILLSRGSIVQVDCIALGINSLSVLERQETVLIHEGTVDSKWMNDLSARLTAAESQLKTACNTNTKDIQQLRDLVAAYQMKM